MNIDREIAEKVFGFQQPPTYHWYEGNKHRFSFDDWHPSTDIKQAFEVDDRMAENGWDLVLERTQIYGSIWMYQATYTHLDRDVSHKSGYQKTPKIAICLAALKAMEAK